MKLSRKPRAVLLQLSPKQPKMSQQPRRRRLLIRKVLEIHKLHWSKISHEVVLVGVRQGCILTVQPVVVGQSGLRGRPSA